MQLVRSTCLNPIWLQIRESETQKWLFLLLLCAILGSEGYNPFISYLILFWL